MRPTCILGPLLTLGLALALPLSAPLSAQMHHVDKPQRVTRAVGVYEWTGDIKKPDAARLIPVSLFTNSHFEDAGVFLAQPVPLALETGNVYAIQHSGDPVGTLDLDFARNLVDRRSVTDDNPIGAWYGYGRYLPLEAAQPVEKLTQHSAHPAVVVSSDPDDDRPHFVNRSPGEAGNSTPTAGSSTASASTPAPPDDPDRPTMTKRDPNASSTDNAPSSSGTRDVDVTGRSSSGGDVGDDPDRPTLGRRTAPPEGKKKKEKESGSGVEAMAKSLNDDPNRPMVHRGKVESATAPPQLTGVPPNLHQAIAVSDAASNPTHVFAREWGSPTERASTLADMQKLAQPIAQQYLVANHLQPAAPAPTAPTLVRKTATKAATQTTGKTAPKSHTTAHRASTPAAPASLSVTDEQIAGYTLSYGGLPTFIYTAAVPTADDQALYVTVVAQRLPSGELQTSLTSVTDSTHLNRVPWMRFVDAVDPDDSHRASLLFELRAKNSRQFALYSLTSAQAQQSFVTGIIE